MPLDVKGLNDSAQRVLIIHSSITSQSQGQSSPSCTGLPVDQCIVYKLRLLVLVYKCQHELGQCTYPHTPLSLAQYVITCVQQLEAI